MHKKIDVLKKSQVYKIKVENQLGRIIKIIRTNSSGEQMFDLFDNFLKQHDIVHHFFMPFSLQQNSIAERHNKTLLDMVRSVLCHFLFSLYCSGEAIITTRYLLNLVRTKSCNRTIHGLWTGKKPN